jgi:hypothetical protein
MAASTCQNWTAGGRFSADRAVREYVEQYYLPAATAYGEHAAVAVPLEADRILWQR